MDGENTAVADVEKSQSSNDERLKMAVAVALLKSRFLQKENAPPNGSNNASASSTNTQLDDTALKWKRKAKERKEQILRLQEDLKAAEDGMQWDLFPRNASCKCYFFDSMGVLGEKQMEDSSDWRFSDVLRRRFLRQVRMRDRRRKRDATRSVLGTTSQNEVEQLSASVDFLVELCDTVSPVKVEEIAFKNWSHQAVDFILGALKALLPLRTNIETVEGIINSLIMRLLRRMCNSSQEDESESCDTDVRFYTQHLLRQLGSDSYLGQRVILSVSQGISTAAESLLFMDPFDDAFLNMHDCLHMMIQLVEFLVSDYLVTWSSREDFEMERFEEWLSSILHARRALEVLESRNTLYVMYMDRVIGDVGKKVGQSSFHEKLKPEIIGALFS